MEPLQFFVGDIPPDGRDAARFAAARETRVDHRAVVGAVAGRLHNDVAGKAEVIAQGEQLRLARVAWRVLALGGIGEFGPRAEHVAMRVDAAGRQGEARLAGAVEPVEPAIGLLEWPGHGLRDRVHRLGLNRYI